MAFAFVGSVIAALMTLQPVIPGAFFLMVLICLVKYEEIARWAITFYANSISPFGRRAWDVYPTTYFPGE